MRFLSFCYAGIGAKCCCVSVFPLFGFKSFFSLPAICPANLFDVDVFFVVSVTESQSTNCSGFDFLCDFGQKCIPLDGKCNGVEECEDRSDERNCPPSFLSVADSDPSLTQPDLPAYSANAELVARGRADYPESLASLRGKPDGPLSPLGVAALVIGIIVGGLWWISLIIVAVTKCRKRRRQKQAIASELQTLPTTSAEAPDRPNTRTRRSRSKTWFRIFFRPLRDERSAEEISRSPGHQRF